MGDMVKCMGQLINQALPTFIGVAVDQLCYDDNLPTTLTVCNNSAWFIGKVAAADGTKPVLHQFI